MIEPNEVTTEDDARTVAGVRLRAVQPVPDRDDPARNVAAEQAVRDLLVALGEDPDRPGLRETPRRVAAAMTELLTPVAFTPTTFPNDEGYDQLIMARERIVGLSKLARVVERFSRDLQVQERLTGQIASWLDEHLEPLGVGVVL